METCIFPSDIPGAHLESLNVFLLVGTGLMFVGLLLGTLSARFGVPSLLVFLVVGMAAGEDGLGGIEFDDFSLAYVVSNIALAVILLDGGLRTRLSTFRLGLKPALSLATLGWRCQPAWWAPSPPG